MPTRSARARTGWVSKRDDRSAIKKATKPAAIDPQCFTATEPVRPAKLASGRWILRSCVPVSVPVKHTFVGAGRPMNCSPTPHLYDIPEKKGKPAKTLQKDSWLVKNNGGHPAAGIQPAFPVSGQDFFRLVSMPADNHSISSR